jgi:hypothetical protein
MQIATKISDNGAPLFSETLSSRSLLDMEILK